MLTLGSNLQQLDPVSLEPIELFTYQTTNVNITDGKTCAHPAQYVLTHILVSGVT